MTTSMRRRGFRWYLAGPLFTAQERAWNEELAKFLRGEGVDVFLPQEGEPRGLEGTALVYAVFDHDLSGLEECGGVVANLDGPDADSGTCWEVGWAYARGYPCIGYRTDSRASEGPAPSNLMLAGSCDPLLYLPTSDLQHLCRAILNEILWAESET